MFDWSVTSRCFCSVQVSGHLFFILDEQVPLLIIFQMLVETEMCHQVLQLLDWQVAPCWFENLELPLTKKTCDVSISWAFSVLLIQNALCFFISVSILPVQNSTIVAETSESVQARSVKPFFYWEKSCVEILRCVRISVQGIRFRYQKKINTA
jgi:hypothetical protein